MSVAAALVLAAGILLIAIASRPVNLSERIGKYLRPAPPSSESGPDPIEESPAADAGLVWSRGEILLRRSATAAAGAVVGALVSQGDLFVEGPGRAVLPLAALGAATGWLVFGMWISTRRDRRARMLRFELPIVTDALSLHVIAGESVSTAIRRYVDESTGVAADEFQVAINEVEDGRGISESLQRNTRRTADAEAARLYTLLAHAHDTGGRLADALGDLGADYRAALARDLTIEGGRRALTTYGPILALMVPVTLLFLLYPTLVGLRGLAGDP
ncbi:MAG: type II secretion system F family protein [Actinomycetota bacterium]|nr:type II secretion system F family protein [Actinomycetota bacterium]